MREAIAAACLFLGGWLVLGGVRSFVLGLRSRRWPKVDGVIRKAKVVTSRNSDGDDVSWQELEYTYSAGGRVYRSTRERLGVPRRLAGSNAPLRVFRRGERVTVYYSRSRPGMSVLRTGVSPFVFVTLTAGGVIVWVGIRLLS